MNILITGASRGIGFEVARQFAALGDNNIVAIARSEGKLKELKNACIRANIQAHLYPVVFDLEAGQPYEETLLPRIQQHIDSIDILVNNAGLLVNKPFDELSDEEMLRMTRVNYLAPARLIRAVRQLLKPGAHIINIGSMGGFQGTQKFRGLSMYSSGKAALASLTECLAEEYKGTGITANCLALGATDTEMLREAFPGYKAPVNSNDMAEYIVDFALRGAKYFNGKIIPVSSTTP
jgi:NAD(P)-dependent dehydrogenase (short-subunit alcohol dehydrogenase family)